ncbi:MAG TPA: DUF4136 domain-containing protein [Geminicoccus sp.]|uniref:DUF4136 domain-containing protein n=1 Tax=Geminicoccus sp. TaxID=2024832 RepID=UPI002C6C4DC3|nr:DUF4136 domain-containing protein [Geminicoccus sp.]HWL69094.1 DUF4136 domain-containing protein [Geminicoccus sp.]
MGPIRAVVVVAALWLAACAGEPSVRSDWDRTVDFTVYRSFGFPAHQGTDFTGYSSLETQRLRAAVRREMAGRGFVEVATAPDLLVDFRTRQADRLRVISLPPVWPAYPYDPFWYPGGFYRPWYGGYTDVQAITEGVLTIDLIDLAERRIVWEGVATGQALQGEDPLARADLDATVRRIFLDFPVQPGGS